MIYKDVCNPITKEFREELYGNILEAFEKVKEQDKEGEHTEGMNVQGNMAPMVADNKQEYNVDVKPVNKGRSR